MALRFDGMTTAVGAAIGAQFVVVTRIVGDQALLDRMNSEFLIPTGSGIRGKRQILLPDGMRRTDDAVESVPSPCSALNLEEFSRMASDLSKALQNLHQLLHQLEDSDYLLAHGPRRIAAAEKAVRVATEDVENQKLAVKSARKHADECNLKLRSKEAELLKLTGMMNQASSNKEYDIVKAQLAAAGADRAQLEDAALAAMEQADSGQQKLKQLEADLRACEENFRTIEAEVKAAEPGVAAEVQRIQAEVEAVEKTISWGELVSNYGRLRGAHIAGALACVEDGFCTACNNRITTQDIVRINTGTLLACRECGRLVYIV